MKRHNCAELAKIINVQSETAQNNLIQCIFEFKNWEAGVNSGALEGIIERFHSNATAYPLRDLVSHQVLLFTTTKVGDISTQTMTAVRSKFSEVSVYTISKND